jgi:hypothetical protein
MLHRLRFTACDHRQQWQAGDHQRHYPASVHLRNGSRKKLMAGFTTVREFIDVGLRNAINAGLVVGFSKLNSPAHRCPYNLLIKSR